MGQGRICLIWVPTVDHIYDQVLQAQATRKQIGIIAGQGNVTVTQAEVDAWRLDNPDETDEAGNLYSDASVRVRLLTRKCETLYVQHFAQRSSRKAWDNVQDLTAKSCVQTKGLDRFKNIK